MGWSEQSELQRNKQRRVNGLEFAMLTLGCSAGFLLGFASLTPTYASCSFFNLRLGVAWMFRTVLQNLRIFIVFAFGGLLLACAQAQTVPAAAKGEKRNVTSENLVVRYFADADLQAETRQQLREIRRALEDALTLPIAELRIRRYADYTMTVDRWTFGKLIGSYFMSAQPMDTESENFYEDSKKPEAVATLKRRLTEVEEAIPHGAGE
jgi:hypothetical protein